MMRNVVIRPVTPEDYGAWRPLWDGYNAFYGRHGSTALPEPITESTWQRFVDAAEPMFALVAEHEGSLVGLTHYLFHRSMTKIEPICYLSDLYTLETLRGKGIGRALIEAVCAEAKSAGVKRVYWQTQVDNTAGRLLYDKVAKHNGFIVYSRDM
jgi:GNAT superfamily N-acetyltransferase